MTRELLSPQDATLWSVQTAEAPLQIGGLALFDAAALHDADGNLRDDDLRRRLEAVLPGAPRFRCRLVELPFDQGPALVDDEHFDIGHHVRVDDLRAPVSEAQLRAHIRGLLACPLDPDRPLWDLRVIDGVAGGRVAIVLRVSHVIADGMGLLGFVFSLVDPGPPPAGDQAADHAVDHEADHAVDHGDQGPEARWLLFDGPLGRAGRRARSVWTLARGMADRRLLTTAARALVRIGTGQATPVPSLPVTAPVGGRRDFAWLRLDLPPLIEATHAQGVTLNDAVLAIVGGGLARYVGRAGEQLGERAPTVLVPMATRDGAGAGNRFTILLAEVPLRAANPLERLRSVHAEMERHKRSAQAQVGPLLFAGADLVPNWVLRTAGPAILRRQPFANLAVTNLPGSRDPLFLLGARMTEVFPFITVVGNIALIIGVLSYEDSLGVSFTVDVDVVDDLDVLVECVTAAAHELVAAVDGSAGGGAGEGSAG